MIYDCRLKSRKNRRSEAKNIFLRTMIFRNRSRVQRLDNQQDFQQKLFVHCKAAEIAKGYIFIVSGDPAEKKRDLQDNGKQ